MKLNTAACECEHSAHFDKNDRTPDGNPGHKYGQKFSASHLRQVKTPYGTFLVCADCEKDCLYTFSVKENPKRKNPLALAAFGKTLSQADLLRRAGKAVTRRNPRKKRHMSAQEKRDLFDAVARNYEAAHAHTAEQIRKRNEETLRRMRAARMKRNPDAYPKTRGARNAVKAWRGSHRMVRVEFRAPRGKSWQTAYILPDTPDNRIDAEERAKSLSALIIPGAKLRVTVK